MSEDYFKQIKALNRRIGAIIQVLKIHKPDLCINLLESSATWAPEILSSKMAEWIFEHFPINPNDMLTIVIYSLYSTRTFDEIKTQMLKDTSPDVKPVM